MNQKGERKSEFHEDSDDSVVDFQIVYFQKVFTFLSCNVFAVIGQDLLAQTIYICCTEPEKVDTHPTNTTLLFLAIYFLVGDFTIFFFCEFFRVDQERLTFERLDFAGKFSFTE